MDKSRACTHAACDPPVVRRTSRVGGLASIFVLTVIEAVMAGVNVNGIWGAAIE
jgi:hypothetical protein